MVNGVSALLMGAVTAGLLLVESPFQGSESHRRAAGGHHSPGRAGPGGWGACPPQPQGLDLGDSRVQPSVPSSPGW